jgi:DNA-binding transcriptional regulator YiaG
MQTNEVIVNCRRDLGLSRPAFAERVGVTGMTVYRWERRQTLPRREHWPILEEMTGRPIQEILAAGMRATDSGESE